MAAEEKEQKRYETHNDKYGVPSHSYERTHRKYWNSVRIEVRRWPDFFAILHDIGVYFHQISIDIRGTLLFVFTQIVVYVDGVNTMVRLIPLTKKKV